VERIIKGDIVHKIRVVDRRYTVRRRHILLGMLVRLFHVFMQHWITNKHIISHLSLRWMVTFVIRLFIFIDLGSNYSYVSLDLVDKCGLSKEFHVEYWLVQLAIGTKK